MFSDHLQLFILSGTIPPSVSVAALLWGLFTLYTTLATAINNISTPTKAKNTAAVEFTVDALSEDIFTSLGAAG